MLYLVRTTRAALAALLMLLCAACALQPAPPSPTPSTPATAGAGEGATAAVTLPDVSTGEYPAPQPAVPAASGAPGEYPAPQSPAAGASTATPAAVVALPDVSGAPGDTSTPTAPAGATATPASVIIMPGVTAPQDPVAVAGPTVVPDAEIEATVGGHALRLRVVATPEKRAAGLMFYRELPDDLGMLFVFPVDQELSFWMRNTLVPLSVAYLDAERRILNVEDMQPLDEQTFHRSAGPARYALEVRQGWFAARGIGAGAVVEFTLPAGLPVQ